MTQLDIKNYKNILTPQFWIPVLLCILVFSFAISKSLLLGFVLLFLTPLIPIFWKVISDHKLLLLIILMSILPGMLGRFTTAPKSGTAILLTDVLVLVFVVSFIMKKLFQDKKWNFTKLHAFIGSFFLIMCISYLNGIYHLYNLGTIELKELIVSLMYLFRWLGYATIFFFLTNEIKTSKEIKKWFIYLMWITFFTAILGFLQLIFYPDFFEMFVKYGWDPHKGRLLGTFFDPNLIGSFFAMNITVLLGVVMFIKKERKWFMWLIAILVIALALTLSRSAYIALVGGFLLLSIFKSRVSLVIGLTVLIIGIGLNPTIFNRISQGVSIDDSAAKHIESWVDGKNIISAYPLLGVGYNFLPSVYDDLALIDEWDVNNKSGIENSLFTVWVTTGLFGLLAYLLIWGTVFIESFKNSTSKSLSPFIRGLNFGIMGGLISILLSSMFVNTLFFSYIVIYLWFFAAFVIISTNLKKNKAS